MISRRTVKTRSRWSPNSHVSSPISSPIHDRPFDSPYPCIKCHDATELQSVAVPAQETREPQPGTKGTRVCGSHSPAPSRLRALPSNIIPTSVALTRFLSSVQRWRTAPSSACAPVIRQLFQLSKMMPSGQSLGRKRHGRAVTSS